MRIGPISLALAFGKDRLFALGEDTAAILGAARILGGRSLTEHFDVIVIGAGQAGPSLAGRLAATAATAHW